MIFLTISIYRRRMRRLQQGKKEDKRTIVSDSMLTNTREILRSWSRSLKMINCTRQDSQSSLGLTSWRTRSISTSWIRWFPRWSSIKSASSLCSTAYSLTIHQCSLNKEIILMWSIQSRESALWISIRIWGSSTRRTRVRSWTLRTTLLEVGASWFDATLFQLKLASHN